MNASNIFVMSATRKSATKWLMSISSHWLLFARSSFAKTSLPFSLTCPKNYRVAIASDNSHYFLKSSFRGWERIE
jgi:hypothetical protein